MTVDRFLNARDKTRAMANEFKKRTIEPFSYEYTSFDDKTLSRIASKLGHGDSSRMGGELLKFLIGLIPPSYFSSPIDVDGVNDTEYPLPIYMYPAVNYFFIYYMKALKNDNKSKVKAEKGGEPTTVENEEWNISDRFLKIAPKWYYEKYREMNDMALLNNYVIFVLNTYENYVNNSDGREGSNEVRRRWFEDHFPWVREERRKTRYMMKKISDKMSDIAIDGIRKQEDLLFMYFYDSLFRREMIQLPEYVQNYFMMSGIFIGGTPDKPIGTFTHDGSVGSFLVPSGLNTSNFGKSVNRNEIISPILSYTAKVKK